MKMFFHTIIEKIMHIITSLIPQWEKEYHQKRMQSPWYLRPKRQNDYFTLYILSFISLGFIACLWGVLILLTTILKFLCQYFIKNIRFILFLLLFCFVIKMYIAYFPCCFFLSFSEESII